MNVDVKAKEGWVLVESPTAKLASHEVASSACWIAAELDSDPEPDSGSNPDPSSVVVPVVLGESLEDLRLHENKFQITYQLQEYSKINKMNQCPNYYKKHHSAVAKTVTIFILLK